VFFSENRTDYYSSPDRPEYGDARANFMRIIGDQSLGDDVRIKVAQRFAYHALREGTLTKADASNLGSYATPEWQQYLDGGIPADEPNPREVVGAIVMAVSIRLNLAGLSGDLEQQRAPLGQEIQGWLAAAGKTEGLPQAAAFDSEPLARSFARLLARRRPAQDNNSPDAAAALQDGARVIRAVAEDPDLRGRVFAMAENALGTCGDNVAQGFSQIVLAVNQHQMAKAVERGEVNAAGLNRETRQLFRLDVLEQEVHRLIAHKLEATEADLAANEAALAANEQKALRASGPLSAGLRLMLTTQHTELKLTHTKLTQTKNQLTNEPVETMLHAKVHLRTQLELPDGLPTTEANRVSVLDQGDLKRIKAAIQAREAEGSELRAFVLSDPDQLWLTAMKKLHADELAPIQKAHDDDPVWAEELHPPKGEIFADWQTGYESRSNAVRQKAEAAERELLFRLAGM
jgi:hypothetical protein